MESTSNGKRQHSSQFKINVVTALLKQEETMSQICSRFGIHPTQARRWKEKALQALKHSFDGSGIEAKTKEKEQLIEELYKQIGKLKVEVDWLKKKIGLFN